MKTKLYVFFGGRSVEHDVSIVTGLQALENVDKSKYDAYPIYIARDGQWYTGEKLTDVSVYKQFDPKKCGAVPIRLSSVPGEGMVVRQTRKARFGAVEEYDAVLPVDVALLCMHGLHGEDGSLQGMLEMSDIPYTSTSIGASASGMDKALMKKVFCGCGFPNPIYVDFTRFEWEHDQQAIINDINEKISYFFDLLVYETSH